MKRGPWPVAWGALGLGLWAHPAHAQPSSPFELSWTAPRPCPSAASVRAQIFRLAPSPRAREAPLLIEATVREQARGFVLELVLRDGELVGRRRFESGSCEEVAGAAAVTIALLLSSTGRESLDQLPGAGEAPAPGEDKRARSEVADRSSSEATSREAGERADRSASGAERRRQTRDPTEAARRWRWLVIAPTLSGSVGLLSEPSLGLGGGFGVEIDSWRFVLSGTYTFDQRLESAEVPDVAVEVARRVARLEACRWLGHHPLQIAPCAMLALQHLVGRGIGSDVSSNDANFTWAAFGPRLTSRLWLSDPVALSASAGLELQTARPSLVVEGLGEIQRIGAIELVFLVGAEWIL